MQAEVVQHPNKVEIRLAAFDLWRLLHLQTFLVANANPRRAVVNRRRRELPRIHEQYDAVDARCLRHVEALDLEKQPVMDLTRRLAQARVTQETGGQ